MTSGTLPELERLVAVMARLRTACPWDAEQTHMSLVQYLVEETAETIEAIESGDGAHLREELGDLLLQVVFHAQIASETDPDTTLETIAAGIADKLIRRHPYVYADGDVPTDLLGSWEERKAVEKGRTSALDGIAEPLSALARGHKVIHRARTRGVPVDLPTAPITDAEVGTQILGLLARAQASGVDPDQAVRAATRRLEATVTASETTARRGVPDPAAQ